MENASSKVLPSVAVDASSIPAESENPCPNPAKERLPLVLEGSTDGFWDWDLQTDEVYYSRSWKEMLGYTDAELRNHLDTWKELVHPSDRERGLKMAQEVTEGRAPKFEVEFRMRHKDGHWVDILSRALVVFDEECRPRRLVGTHVDVTDLRHEEMEIRRINDSLEELVHKRTAELEASQARLALLVETVPAAIVIHDPDGRIVHSNLTAQRLLGLSEEEAQGKPLEDRAWRFLREDGTMMDVSEYPVSQVINHRTAFWNRLVGIQHTDKPVIWTLVNALPQIGPDGQISEVIVGFMDVTARVVAEAALRQANETLEQQVAQRTAALRESENRFRTLAEATFEGVMLSRNGIIKDCNEQLGAILGYTTAELIGRAVIDFVPPEWRDRVRTAIAAGRQSAFEHEALCKDGSRRIVETHGRSPDGAKGTRLTAIRDITERKRAEEALRESEMRFRQLAEVSTDAIAITENGYMVDGNSQLAKLLGLELKDMIGRQVLDFVPEHSHETVAKHLRIISRSIYESYALRNDGSEIPVEICGQTMLWQGKPRRVSIMRDLTEERRNAEQLENLRTALERSRRMAELSEISAAVVHQLGQPFSAIASNVSAARHCLKQDDCPRKGMDEALAAVEANLHNVRAIMSQLRALIHPDQAQREPADINQLVNEVLSVLRAEAQRHRISIDFKPAVALPMVALDRVQISQVIFNLVRNAFDAVISCPPERRLVNISTAALPAGGIELTVRDHGSGIAPGAEKQIFEAFFTTKTDGMGIGLRIGRTITKAHGGRLEGGNNTDGPGAWFRMVLPG